MDNLTFGQLLDLLDRAFSVIHESDEHREHNDLQGDLKDAADLIRREIGGSHMGAGADEIAIGCATILPEWSGRQCDVAPDTCWIDDATGEHVDAVTAMRTTEHPEVPRG